MIHQVIPRSKPYSEVPPAAAHMLSAPPGRPRRTYRTGENRPISQESNVGRPPVAFRLREQGLRERIIGLITVQVRARMRPLNTEDHQ